MMIRFIWIQTICFICLVTITCLKEGEFHLDANRKLQNVLIYIADDVTENGTNLLDSVKKQFLIFSKLLFEATNNMKKNTPGVMFGEVFIRIPMTWKMKAEPITWQQCVKSEIQIVPLRENGNSIKPFTRQLKKCGEPGDLIRFPDSFFNINYASDPTTEIYGKIMMREFVKFRYGVYDEVPLKNKIIAFNGSTFIRAACNENIDWKAAYENHLCTEPNNRCFYEIKPNQNHNYSVMFDANTPSSRYFCNDEDRPHNKFASNLHNKKCKKQSISKVILRHKDFYQVSSISPRYEEPLFKIVKGVQRKIVLIIDTSASMWDYYTKMKSAISDFISGFVEHSAQLGIVVFNDEAEIKSEMVKMNNKDNRKNLSDIVKNIPCHGGTNIAHGLELGIQVLGGDIRSSDTLFGTIIMMSDGIHNENTTIDFNYAVDQVIRKGVVTYTVSFNQSDSLLNKLSEQTKGMFLHATHNSTITELLQKFVFQKPCDLSAKGPSQVQQGKLFIKQNKRKFEFTYIDKYIGINPRIDIDFKRDMSGYSVKLSSPTGNDYDPISISNDKLKYVFQIQGIPEDGFYTMKIQPLYKRRFKRSLYSMSATYSISSNPQNDDGRIIIPNGEISDTSFAMVTEKSSLTVTIDLSNCGITQVEHVNVKLIIKTPTKKFVKQMTDYGLGDDMIGEDKIFAVKLNSRDLGEKGFYDFNGLVEISSNLTNVKITRSVQFESLLVRNVDQSAFIDKVAPAQMEEPMIRIINLKNKIIELKSIATGDDSMEGRISKYQVLIKSSTKEEIRNIIKNAEPFSKITFKLDLKFIDLDKISEIAIRGVDKNDNVGEWSSTIPFIFHQYFHHDD